MLSALALQLSHLVLITILMGLVICTVILLLQIEKLRPRIRSLDLKAQGQASEWLKAKPLYSSIFASSRSHNPHKYSSAQAIPGPNNLETHWILYLPLLFWGLTMHFSQLHSLREDNFTLT